MQVSKVFSRAYAAWSGCGNLRSRRERCKRFTYGDQWGDAVPDGHGGYIREGQQIVDQGKRPYTNNLIRQLVKGVVGRYRTIAREQGYYGGSVGAIARRNALEELDARALEEFLISGCAIQRVSDERRWNGNGVWVDNVDPRRFFVNAFTDPRGWDIDLVGMLHDMSLPELINRFSGGDGVRAAELKRIYSGVDAEPSIASAPGSVSFHVSADPERCRVVEVWSFDSRPSADGSSNAEFCWHCRNFAPDGTLLAEYDSPYAHGSHPFVIKFYPLTDGEVHSFVEDVLDQQKFINRLIVMLDHITACSAKGVLLYPLDQLPEGITLDQVVDVWAQADGLIPVTGRGAVMPQQVSGSGASAGAYQLLDMQMKLFEHVSGVGSALMGRSQNARGADMLASEVQNATTALADLFESFRAFTRLRNEKALRVRSAVRTDN